MLTRPSYTKSQTVFRVHESHFPWRRLFIMHSYCYINSKFKEDCSNVETVYINLNRNNSVLIWHRFNSISRFPVRGQNTEHGLVHASSGSIVKSSYFFYRCVSALLITDRPRTRMRAHRTCKFIHACVPARSHVTQTRPAFSILYVTEHTW